MEPQPTGYAYWKAQEVSMLTQLTEMCQKRGALEEIDNVANRAHDKIVKQYNQVKKKRQKVIDAVKSEICVLQQAYTICINKIQDPVFANLCDVISCGAILSIIQSYCVCSICPGCGMYVPNASARCFGICGHSWNVAKPVSPWFIRGLIANPSDRFYFQKMNFQLLEEDVVSPFVFDLEKPTSVVTQMQWDEAFSILCAKMDKRGLIYQMKSMEDFNQGGHIMNIMWQSNRIVATVGFWTLELETVLQV